MTPMALLGARGGRSVARKRGRAWMILIGRRGGLATSERYSYETRRSWGNLGPAAKEKRDATP